MALSLTSSTLFSPSPSSSSSSSSLTSSYASLSSSQLQFPSLIRRSFRNSSVSVSPRRPRLLVEAKKQTFSSFDELVTNSDKPVLVDFYATWCGPCQLMVPILEKASDALKDKIQVVKIDTEKYPALANEYKIEALPTFILFKDGKPYDRFEGALPVEKLVQRIEGSLAVKS